MTTFQKVNKTQQKIASFSLLAVYGLAIWLFCCHGYDLHSSKQQTGPEKFHSLVSNSLKGDALQPLTFGSASFSNIHSSSKNSINEFVTVLKLTDHLVASTLIQYSSYSDNTPVRYRKTDIIFPFHYFW